MQVQATLGVLVPLAVDLPVGIMEIHTEPQKEEQRIALQGKPQET